MTVERNDHERVVITGMGWVTPLGCDLDTVWKRLMAADSGMAPITRFDAATFPTTFAAEVRDFDVDDFVDDPAVHADAGLNVQFALGAARQAWTQAGLAALCEAGGEAREAGELHKLLIEVRVRGRGRARGRDRDRGRVRVRVGAGARARASCTSCWSRTS